MQSAPAQPSLQQQLQQDQQPAIMQTLTAGNAATAPSWVPSQAVSQLDQVAPAMATGGGFVPPTQATARLIATAATEALKKLTADAKRMRADAARRAKQLTLANSKLHKRQQEKAEVAQQLQDQGAFEGIDIDATTVKQLQDRKAEVAKQRQEVAERHKVVLEELEQQQQIVQILELEDSESDARFARELNDILESLIQQVKQKQSAEQQSEVEL